jgi:hypothetical protein
MSGYLTTWIEYEKEAAEVRASNPQCTGSMMCPADQHYMECSKYRRELRPNDKETE